MLFVCRPKVLHKHCLQFLLGVKKAPRETENNTYVKFWGDKQRALWYVMVFLECDQYLRACLHGGGRPQVSEVTCLGEVKKNNPPLQAVLQPRHPGVYFLKIIEWSLST